VNVGAPVNGPKDDFAFVIDSPPEVMGDAVDLHENLVQVPPPMRKGPHSIHPLAANLGGEHWPKSVPPEPHGLMADLDAALMQEVLDVAERERIADIEHHRQADDFGARLEVPEGGALGHLARLGDSPILLKEFALTTPDAPLIFAASQSVTTTK
jgi:hypothetical protein